MLKVIARSRIKPGCKDEYMSKVRELVERSRAEEGCISYTLNQSQSDPNLVSFFEEWKDQAAFDFHKQTEHFTSILPELSKLREDGPPAEIFTEISF